ncbi:MAG: pyridoxamine 5'-phosphate oxidase family protein [Chloroflexi bacterium]|nr:pyridoxamine 5'-phosphate oxidase family protein [Chloroflexota bacterium]
MIKFDDEMKEHINNALMNGTPCILATASLDGQPTIGYRGSLRVLDNDHLAFWERSKRDGLENIRVNPKVTIAYRDPKTRKAWKIYGRAKVYDEGPIREEIMNGTIEIELRGDPERQGVGVIVSVDKITSFRGEVLQERDKD